MSFVALWQYPRLKRKSSRIRTEHREEIGLGHQARTSAHLMLDDVAKDAALFEIEVRFGSVDLLANALGNHRQGDQLGVRVLERCSRRLAMVLEKHRVAQPAVLPQIDYPVLEGP